MDFSYKSLDWKYGKHLFESKSVKSLSTSDIYDSQSFPEASNPLLSYSDLDKNLNESFVKNQDHLRSIDNCDELSRKWYSLPHHYKSCVNSSWLCSVSQALSPSFPNPNEFREKFCLMKQWFNEFSDEQKNRVLSELLEHIGTSQLHLLSVAIGERLHEGCPPNCQDPISWLPIGVGLHIFSYLDPPSLARASQTCRFWHNLANSDILWKKLCFNDSWNISLASHKKQSQQWTRDNGTVHWKQVWNMRTNSQWSVQTLVGHSGMVRCIHLAGNRIVSGSADATIKVWDIEETSTWSSITCKVTMVGHASTVRCLQVDGEKVVSGSYDHTVRVWQLANGSCLCTLLGHEGPVLTVAFDCSVIISGAADKTIKIWCLESGRCEKTLIGHEDGVTTLTFDETRIISGSLDCTIRLWCKASGQCVGVLDWMSSEGHTGVIRCLAADSWRIVSASDDKTIKVWDRKSGLRLVTLRSHTDGVTCLAFNDYMIISGSYDKTVKLWDFSVC